MATSVDSFQVKVYQGDSAVLFAFDVADADRADLAGFAIQCTPQGGRLTGCPTGSPSTRPSMQMRR